jgi:hypothetical protein
VPTSPRRRAATEGDFVNQVLAGKYDVKAVIGRGGMGTVYDATHRMTNRRVAIKVLLPEHASKPESIARFQQEARVVAAIGHSHICEILDFGTLDDGRPYLVMERLEGQTLGTLLEVSGRLGFDVVIPIVQQVLLALSAAHAKGVIHRDMKPDNVFLIQRPGSKAVTAKVLDFGISKAITEDREVELTRTGMVMGTPYYMAPEQARGDRGLDPRVDVWAVGVILYECLSGRRPFHAKNYNALLVEILTQPHRPIAMAEVPPELEAVVDRALRKRRDERFGSVEQLYAALEPFAVAAAPVRPKVDKYVEIGGVQIPVTWEDTGGGETPASAGGVKMLDVAALRHAIQAEAIATGGAGRPPGHVAAAARAGAGLLYPGGVRPEAYGSESATRPGGRSPAPSSTPEPATRRSGTGKPPPIDDEETTMVLLESDVSTEEPTPPLRRAGSAIVPPAPPPEGRQATELPAEDTETTIVDSEPPNFSTDAYRAVRDRRDS